MQGYRITLHSALIIRILSSITLVLLAISFLDQVALNLLGIKATPLTRIVSVDAERNLPTFFTIALLLFAALLLLIITILKHQSRSPYWLRWLALSVGFVAMAMDEAFAFHERLVDPMRDLLGTEQLGMFYFAWTIPAILLVTMLGFFFLRFLLSLPRRTKWLFILAGALYLGGAIGMELIGGAYVQSNGRENLVYSLLATIEEGLEMAGVILFIGALLAYLADRYTEVRVQFDSFTSNASGPPSTEQR